MPYTKRKRRSSRRIVLSIVATFVSIIFAIPIVVAVLTSFKSNSQVFTTSSLSLPHGINLSSYWQVLTEGGFGHFLLNSLIVAGIGSAVQVVAATMAGYALARLPFPGRSAVFWLVLVTLMLPPQLLVIALFLLVARVPFAGGNGLLSGGGTGLLNSYPGLIAPYLISGLSVFLMRQFFLGLPEELADSGRVDGCSEGTLFVRIFVPLIRPAVWVVLLLGFQSAWLDLLWPLLVANTPSLYTVQVGLTTFQQEYTAEWPLIMASAIISSIPVVIIFFFAQRRLEKGLAFTGFK